MDFRASIRRSGNVAILDLEGRATIGTGTELLGRHLERLCQAGECRLLVNLRGVTQIDSSGISTLVRSFVSLERAGGQLKLLAPQGRVREVLSITRLSGVIPTFDDEEQALASFR